VAKLIIYRGDTLDREVELGERNARIGRGDQNEIVLPDPAKSVSRFHAELRFEQGRFTVVDLNSQNGTWVAGRRVQQALLEPGVPVVLGTFRIVLKQEEVPLPPEATDATLIAAPAPAARPAGPPAVTSTSATMVGAATAAPPPAAPAAPKVESAPPPPPAPTPVPAPAPKVEPPPPPKPEPPAPKPEAPPPPRPAPKPEPPPAPKPAPKPEPAPPPKAAPAPPAPAPPKPTPPRDDKKRKPGMPKGVLFGGLAVLVIGAAAAAVFLTPLKDRIPGLSGGQPTTESPAGPAPAQEAARPAETPGAAATSAPAAAPSAPAAAPPPALRPAEAVPTAAPRPAAATAPRTTPPAAGGGRRGREAPPPAPKPLNLSQTLEEARSAMIKGDYLAAIAGFETILKVDPKYPSAADLLGVAKNGAKNAAQLAVDTGNKAEMSGDYATASKQYDRALQLDPDSTAAPDAIRRMKARMQSEGEDAFRRARQYDAMGRGKDAIPLYERALQLLPSDHASVAVAKERLAALKGGL
jgi:hypothetical protein